MKIVKKEITNTSAKLKEDSIDIDGKAIQIKQLNYELDSEFKLENMAKEGKLKRKSNR